MNPERRVASSLITGACNDDYQPTWRIRVKMIAL
jgi:hypothetical protein